MSVVLDYTGGVFAAKPKGGKLGTDPASIGDTLDLSSGNKFVHVPSANVAYVFSNPPASGTAIDFTLKVTGVNVASGYDLANASYDNVSFSVLSQDNSPSGIFFKPDGQTVYICGYQNASVYEYSLSSAWDISTMSYVGSFSLSSQETTPTDLFFKSDGLKMYLIGNTNDSVYEYNLSTAWDISTASYSQSFSVLTQEASSQGLFFKADGTKMYVTGSSSDSIHEYGLSSAWDISTASLSHSLSVAAQDIGPLGLFFNPDGTKLYFSGFGGDDVNEYDLSTAWDISTASYVRNFFVGSQDTVPTGVTFKSDGTKMYIMGIQSDAVYQYSTTGSSFTPATITYPSSVKWAGGTAPTAPANGETDAFTFFTTDGGTTYYGFHAGDAYS